MAASQGRKPKHLSRTLFWALFSLACASVLLAAAVVACIFFAASEHQAEQALLRQTQGLAKTLETSAEDDDRMRLLAEQQYGMYRITYISSDGQVLYDSVVKDLSEEENHSQRPEIVEAATTGTGVIARRSATVGTDTLYAAVQLEDGTFLRLSESRYTVLSIMASAAFPIVFVLLALVAFAALVASRLARRVALPLNALDVNSLETVNVYEEVTPLIQRLDEQQKALKRQNADLERANDMRREFSSNVTHEMKTPLHVIAGYAELLYDGVASPDDSRKFAQKIHQEAEGLSTLVDEVLTLSRLDEQSGVYGELDLLDVRQVLSESVSRLEEMARTRQVSVETLLPSSPVYVCAGRQLLEEIFRNLIENAIRYNRENGWVRVTAWEEDDRAVVTVADSGMGIREDDLSRVFERFYRAEASRSRQTGGTGLGLAIVKHAVEVADGQVSVKSTLGKGSTFTVTLPAASLE